MDKPTNIHPPGLLLGAAGAGDQALGRGEGWGAGSGGQHRVHTVKLVTHTQVRDLHLGDISIYSVIQLGRI